METKLIEKFISELDKIESPTEDKFYSLQRNFAKKYSQPFFQKDKLYQAYQKMCQKGTVKKRHEIERILQLKNVRSQSGIAVVSVLTKPYECPGECLYCPSEENVPKSYLSGEPAVLRAIANSYHPYKQVQSRLQALEATGHIIDKISVRIIGGTWSYYPKNYRTWFIGQLFRAANEYSNIEQKSNSLESLQLNNELAKARIVELSVETRQDYITEQEVRYYRILGITKVELGVQSLDDEVLLINKRGHDTAATIKATKLLKDYGFKVSYQMMLNLYGSDYQKDLFIFEQLFKNENFKPDHLKIYPLAVVKNSEMHKLLEQKKYIVYDKKQLVGLIADIKKFIPPYCRIERVIRDIPADLIVEGGAKVSNLRQSVELELSKKNYKCQCIRCREIKSNQSDLPVRINKITYKASGSDEVFIQAVDRDNRLIGFCRLRLNDENIYTWLNHKAVIRELHVYGPTVAIGKRNLNAQQHQGWGKKLIQEAEKIALEYGCTKMIVIAGVGVRDYFRKNGYTLKNTYMQKELQLTQQCQRSPKTKISKK